MPIPFDRLWEKCEELHQSTIKDDDVSSILDELTLKINIYRTIEQKKEIPQNELQQMKARTMGEILLTLTKLSLKDNLNVYQELNFAKQYREMSIFIK
jgi:hypothetical protein